LDYGLTISGGDITDLTPLSNITSVHTLSISNNPLLSNLNGLNYITHIDGYNEGSPYALVIDNNMVLIDVSSLMNMSNSGYMEGLLIINNPLLTSLNGLQGFNNSLAGITCSNNDSLINLEGLNNITDTDDFTIYDNDSLLNLNGLDSFEAGGILISNNLSFQNLIGITNSYQSGRFALYNNPSLSSLQGIEQILIFTGITLEGNNSLTDISAISSVSNINIFNCIRIKDNSSLSYCHIEEICSIMDNYYNSASSNCIIENNGADCGSVAEVAYNCGLVPFNDECTEAIDLTIGETIEAYNELATASTQTPSCNDEDRADVWFTVNSGSFTSLDIIAETGYSLQLWEGDCASLTQVANACSESSLNDIPVTSNTDYYVQVWSCASCRLATGLFDILVQDGTLSTQEYAFEGFTMYPNPVNNMLNIKAKANLESITVYNLLGQPVLESNPKEIQASLNMSSLQKGLYLVKVNIGTQEATYKIIKE